MAIATHRRRFAARRGLAATLRSACALLVLLPVALTAPVSATAAPPAPPAPMAPQAPIAPPAPGAPLVPVSPLMAAHLAAHPGGKPINATEISYDGGRFIVTLEPPPLATAYVPDCPRGWFCFYDRIGYGYPRGRLSDCGWQSLATWAWQYRIESVHYNMSSGTARYYYGGTWLYQVGTSRRAIANVSPYRNWADRVRRIC